MFTKNFEDMNTRDIQDWLRGSQIYLDKATGCARLLTMEAIKTAASELAFRYRHENTVMVLTSMEG